MSLKEIELYNFRSIATATFAIDKNFNVIYGDNGVGKTSVLEAIAAVSLGKSFRTRNHKELISFDKKSFVVRAEIYRHSKKHIIGIERSCNNDVKLHINGESQKSFNNNFFLLPVQIVNQDSFSFLEGSPEIRRNFIDWGALQMRFLSLEEIKRFNKALKQRNAALKSGLASGLKQWDIELVRMGEAITKARKEFVNLLNENLKDYLQHYFPKFNFIIKYNCGYGNNTSLQDVLMKNLKKDEMLGYTTIGPHKADVLITVESQKAEKILSRGQKKLFIFLLQLARAKMLPQKPLILIDDLNAELDDNGVAAVVSLLQQQQLQTIITSLEPQKMKKVLSDNCQWFDMANLA